MVEKTNALSRVLIGLGILVGIVLLGPYLLGLFYAPPAQHPLNPLIQERSKKPARHSKAEELDNDSDSDDILYSNE